MAESTLKDISKQLAEEGSHNRESLESVKEVIMKSAAATSLGPSASSRAINAFITGMKQDNLANIERANESARRAEAVEDAVKENTKTLSEEISNIDTSFDLGFAIPTLIAGILGTLVGVLSGALIGGILGAFKEAKLWGKLIDKLTGGVISRMLAAFKIQNIRMVFMGQMGKISTALGNVGATLTSIVDKFKTFGASIKASIGNSKIAKFIMGVGDFITKQATEIKNTFVIAKTAITGLFSGIGGGGGGGIFSTISKGFGVVTKFLGGFASLFSGIGTVAGKVAGFVGKIFLPLRAVMVLFDTVMGAWDGFQKEGILGGIKGAIKGLFKGLIGSVLDLVKDGISWVAEKFGFGEISASLDSFSFSEEFDKIIDAVFAVVGDAFKWISGIFSGVSKSFMGAVDSFVAFDTTKFLADMGASIMSVVNKLVDNVIGLFKGSGSAIMDAVGNIGDMYRNFYASILRFILPTPNANAEWYDIGNLISKVIPESVYKFAGLDKTTGERVPMESIMDMVLPNTDMVPSQIAGDTVSTLSRSMASQQAPIVVIEGSKGAKAGDNNSDNSINSFYGSSAASTGKNFTGRSLNRKY